MLSTPEVLFPSQNEEKFNCKCTHGKFCDETWAKQCSRWESLFWGGIGGTQPQLECLAVLGMLITMPEPLRQKFPFDVRPSGEHEDA